MACRKEMRGLGKWLVCLLLLTLHVGLRAQTRTVHLYYTNPQGSVLAKTDAQGNIIARYDYRPYGSAVQDAGPNGPGYTGHVNDLETGLSYMQQRYYDYSTGRFLSPDPIGPSSGEVFGFNRYDYANNNPVRFTDPDGRKVVFIIRNGATQQDRAATMAYLAKSPTAMHEFSQIQGSSETYAIVFDRSTQDMGYSDQTRTVTINPTSGLVIQSSGAIQSPALGAGHEISHAAEHDRIGTKVFEKNLETPIVSVKNTPDGGMTVTYGIAPEEKRATTVESKIAKELHEAQRNNYNDSKGTVTTCGPTSTKQC